MERNGTKRNETKRSGWCTRKSKAHRTRQQNAMQDPANSRPRQDTRQGQHSTTPEASRACHHGVQGTQTSAWHIRTKSTGPPGHYTQHTLRPRLGCVATRPITSYGYTPYYILLDPPPPFPPPSPAIYNPMPYSSATCSPPCCHRGSSFFSHKTHHTRTHSRTHTGGRTASPPPFYPDHAARIPLPGEPFRSLSPTTTQAADRRQRTRRARGNMHHPRR